MATEIEAKMKVVDLAAIAKRLADKGATRLRTDLEINTFLDTPTATLRSAGSGLRIRTATDDSGKSRSLITLKGPLQPGQLKTREETQFAVTDPAAATKMFEILGYRPTLSFQKRRQSWTFQGCEVELDELPYLGSYVEIEGDSNDRVMAARAALGLADLPLISEGYVAILAKYLHDHGIKEREIRL
jgi:adenylate cyclase, class 2